MEEMQKFIWCHPWFVIIVIAICVVLLEYTIKTVWARILWVYMFLCFVGFIGVGFGTWGANVNVKIGYGITLQQIIYALYNSSTNNDILTLRSQIECLHSRSVDSMTSVSKFSELGNDISSMSCSSNLLNETRNSSKEAIFLHATNESGKAQSGDVLK